MRPFMISTTKDTTKRSDRFAELPRPTNLSYNNGQIFISTGAELIHTEYII